MNIRNKKHIKRLRGMDCFICGHEGEPHHLLRAGGKGMGLKAGDDKCIPLCHFHHMELHGNGNEVSFFEGYGIDYESVKNEAKRLYEESVK